MFLELRSYLIYDDQLIFSFYFKKKNVALVHQEQVVLLRYYTTSNLGVIY
jgi:hypothetical protein